MVKQKVSDDANLRFRSVLPKGNEKNVFCMTQEKMTIKTYSGSSRRNLSFSEKSNASKSKCFPGASLHMLCQALCCSTLRDSSLNIHWETCARPYFPTLVISLFRTLPTAKSNQIYCIFIISSLQSKAVFHLFLNCASDICIHTFWKLMEETENNNF